MMPLLKESSRGSRPKAEYKLQETTVVLYGREYRCIVVHSSAHDKRRLKRLERRVGSSFTETSETLKKACRQNTFAGRMTSTPTVYAMTTKFRALYITILLGARGLSGPLTAVQKKYLEMLEIEPVYLVYYNGAEKHVNNSLSDVK
jgi:hypothetical protein